MNEELAAAARSASLTAFGRSDFLDNIDAMVAMAIIRFVESRPALGRSDKIALEAIRRLDQYDHDAARDVAALLA